MARWFTRRRSEQPSSVAPSWSAASVADLLVERLGEQSRSRVLVLGGAAPAMRAALADRAPGWTVEAADPDPAARRLQVAAGPRPDAVVDDPHADGRHHRFRTTFFAVRAGGPYVIPGGADELGEAPGPLGATLAASMDVEPDDLRRGVIRSMQDNMRLALRMHVAREVVGDHLVLTHDLPDVMVKLDETDGDAWIARADNPHRLLSEIPAVTPPEPPVVEMPAAEASPVADPITGAALRLRDYREVVVDVEQGVYDGPVILPDTYRHNQWKRLVNRRIADVAPRFGVPMTPISEDLPRLEGTYLHLDNEIRGHFGHVMTESLSRLWTWRAALEVDPDVQVLLASTRVRPEISGWEFGFYEAAGIPRDRIVLIREQHRVERLLSGSPMFSHPQFVHPRIVETWDEVGDALARRATPRSWPRRIFVGRKIAKRACTNGADVESLFVRHGFTVVFPEEHPLPDQVAMFRAAEVVAGYAGSGMFQIAFVPQPLHVIQVTSERYTPRNEVLMAAVRGHRIDRITSRAPEKQGIHVDFTFDFEREGAHLEAVLAAL